MTTMTSPTSAAEALARTVHAAWRDGMIAQGREVAEHRMTWDTLDERDKQLDAYIAEQVLAALAAPPPTPPQLAPEMFGDEEVLGKVNGYILTRDFLWGPNGDAVAEVVNGRLEIHPDLMDALALLPPWRPLVDTQAPGRGVTCAAVFAGVPLDSGR